MAKKFIIIPYDQYISLLKLPKEHVISHGNNSMTPDKTSQKYSDIRRVTTIKKSIPHLVQDPYAEDVSPLAPSQVNRTVPHLISDPYSLSDGDTYRIPGDHGHEKTRRRVTDYRDKLLKLSAKKQKLPPRPPTMKLQKNKTWTRF